MNVIFKEQVTLVLYSITFTKAKIVLQSAFIKHFRWSFLNLNIAKETFGTYQKSVGTATKILDQRFRKLACSLKGKL